MDIVVTMISLTHVFNESKPLNQLFHIFRNKTIHSFMIHSETRRHNSFAYTLFTDLRTTHLERIKWMIIKELMYSCQHMEMWPLLFIFIWYQFLCFPPKKTQSMLVDYAVTEMGCFDDYLDAAPRAKKMRGKGISSFILNVSQCIIIN